jgi:type 1 glutamine amidotransferase
MQVLCVFDGWVHPPVTARHELQSALSQLGYQLKRVRSLETLQEMDLTPYCGLALYYHHKKISNQALSALDNYVSSGGGVLAVHSATASFKESNGYFQILGGRFKSHGRVETFEVTPVAPQSGIFAGIPAFQVRDELYVHDLSADIKTHFTTVYQGQPVPVVWTRLHGIGRVCYACPGHRTAIFRKPAYQKILRRGLDWVCGREG